MGRHSKPRQPSRVTAPLLTLLLLANLAVAGAVLATRLPSDNPPVAVPTAEPTRATVASSSPVLRAAAVRALLARRAAAVLQRDRRAFLATVDPLAPSGFRAQQAERFDNMRAVPFAAWSYEVRVDDPYEPPSRVLAKYAGAPIWIPATVLHYRVRGDDGTATAQEGVVTFVQRGDAWYVASDTDLAADGSRTTPELWDYGVVTVVRGTSTIVLGHPGSARLQRLIAAEVDRAVPRVTKVWGRDWSRRVVVLVPDTQRELSGLIDDDALKQIAAVATAEIDYGARLRAPVGERVLVNPPNFTKLGPLGRRVVITHEVTHVAARRTTGPQVPSWLVEGFADYVGYLGSGVSVRVAASELGAEVRRGRIPTKLPADKDLDGDSPRAAQGYEQSWLACRLIVERVGEAGLLRFYRQVGATASRLGGPAAVNAALSSILKLNPAAFLAQWQAYTRNQLG